MQLIGTMDDEGEAVVARLRWVTVLLPAAALAVLLLAYLALESILPPLLAGAIVFAAGALGIVAFSSAIAMFARATLRRLNQEKLTLQAVHKAGLQVASDLGLEATLQTIVDAGRELLLARYGAIAVVEDGALRDLVTSLPPQQDDADVEHSERFIGHVLRIAASARPEREPTEEADDAMLVEPLLAQGRVVGFLGLGEKQGGGFQEHDRRALRLLALQAGVAVHNARTHRAERENDVLRERDRLSRDLYDGTIQSLFGLALKLDASVEGRPIEAGLRRELDDAIVSLNRVIETVRRHAFEATGEEGDAVLAENSR